jgi:hypothetical protein
MASSFSGDGNGVDPNGGVGVRVEHCPEQVMSSEQLVRALTKAEQSGQLDALKRRFK